MSTTHDTHPSALTLERFVLGELDQDELDRVQAHLNSCDVCARVVSDLRSFELTFTPPALPRGSLESRPPARVSGYLTDGDPGGYGGSIWAKRRARVGAVVTAAACAVAVIAGVLLSQQEAADADDGLEGTRIAMNGTNGDDPMAVDPAQRPDPGEGVRLKSAPLELDVYVHDGASTRIVAPGETVHPGERVGFKVHVRERAGEFMIIGWDERKNTYLGFPQDNAHRSVHMDVTPQGGMELDQALQLDAVLGKEHLLGIRCDSAFSFEDAQQAITARLNAAETLDHGVEVHGMTCHTHHTWLDKRDTRKDRNTETAPWAGSRAPRARSR